MQNNTQESWEEAIERSELWKRIYKLTKQIPRENVKEDAMDAPSCATEIEEIVNNLLSKQAEEISEAVDMKDKKRFLEVIKEGVILMAIVFVIYWTFELSNSFFSRSSGDVKCFRENK